MKYMKTILIRLGFIVLALAGGALIFFFLLKIGDTGKGPLSDLTSAFSSNVASLEKKITDKRESRSASLQWFNRYRYNPKLMITADTIFLGAYDDRTAESYESIVALEDSLQVKLPLISLYTAWGSKSIQEFPQLRAQAIYDLGSIPVITWEPWLDDFDPERFPIDPNAENKNLGGMKLIAEGKFDAYIDSWAAAAKEFGHPFFLRLGHEMNDPYRYPWGPQNNKPEEFIAAWRHIKERFLKAEATNVLFLWSPHPAYSYKEFYPGHDMVDWTGVTVLNYGTVATWSQWWSFQDIFNKCYADLSLYGKPIMVTELGSLVTGGDRAQWFSQAMDSFTVNYPAVKAVVFFHTHDDLTTTYKAIDWSFKTDAKVVQALRHSFTTWSKGTEKSK